MPKYRKLWVKATESLDINEMPDDFTRLLWMLLPLGLDREGRGQDNLAWIKAKIMPLREDVTQDRVAQAMAWYAARGMIERYEVSGRRYFWVPTFAHYQGDRTKEAESDYPGPELATYSQPTPDLLPTKLVTDSQVDAHVDADTQGEGTPRKKTRAIAPPLPAQIVAFREAAGGTLLPRKATWPAIIRAVPDGEASLATWREVVTAWMCTPYSPQNINGMLDWFNNGIPKSPPRAKGPTNGNDRQRVEPGTAPGPDFEETNELRRVNNVPPLTRAQFEERFGKG